MQEVAGAARMIARRTRWAWPGWRWRLAALLLALVAAAPARAQEAQVFKPGSAEGEALAFLKSLPREWSGSGDHDCRTYDDPNLERLAPAFIVAAAAFLKAFVETHGAATITSAHRTADEQVCACYGEKGPCAGKPVTVMTRQGPKTVKPFGLSRHQLGIAMDVRAGTGSEHEFACMHEFARANPQFGVHFPLGRYDQPHMELKGSRGATVALASIGPSGRAGTNKITPCQKMRQMLTYGHLD